MSDMSDGEFSIHHPIWTTRLRLITDLPERAKIARAGPMIAGGYPSSKTRIITGLARPATIRSQKGRVNEDAVMKDVRIELYGSTQGQLAHEYATSVDEAQRTFGEVMTKLGVALMCNASDEVVKTVDGIISSNSRTVYTDLLERDRADTGNTYLSIACSYNWSQLKAENRKRKASQQYELPDPYGAFLSLEEREDPILENGSRYEWEDFDNIQRHPNHAERTSTFKETPQAEDRRNVWAAGVALLYPNDSTDVTKLNESTKGSGIAFKPLVDDLSITVSQ